MVEISLGSCYDGPVPASGRARGHREPLWCAWIIRQGAVELVHAGGRLGAGPGELVLVPAGLLRDQDFSPGARIASLRLHLRRADGAPLFRSCPPAVLAAPAGLDRALRELAAAPAASFPDAARRLAALGAALAAWWEACAEAGWLPAPAGAVDPRLGAALAVLEAHGRIAPAPWPALCAASGLSRRQLDRLFRARLGASPAAWLAERCAERATALLADPAMAVKTVAARCGFAGASHFVRWFRRQRGASPGRLRQGA